MSQQALDLRRSMEIVRRHKVLVGIVAALGLLVGAAYAAVNPPMLTSTAIVVLPSSVPGVATEVVIAGSDPVLLLASHEITPSVSVDTLRNEVDVKGLTSYLVAINAKGKTASDTEAIANAVANSYIAYVGAKNSPVGHLVVRMFQPASSATGSSLAKALLTTGLIGAVAGAIVGAIASLAIGRKDRRLRERDEIANSIGMPVLASVPVGHPSDAAGWTKLLEQYKPPAVHAWQLRTALQHLGIIGDAFGQSVYAGSRGRRHDGDGGGMSLGVLSLSSDPRALALGPQFAAFAAGQGIPTAVVVGPQQDAHATATLHTACVAARSASSKLPRLLRLIVSDGQDVNGWQGAALIVVVAVVDARAPKIPDTMRTTATLIGVSAGAATAEQLARVAVAATADGREIAGILVADPEPTDKTTGRVPRLAPPPRRRLPNRLKGIVTTETRR